MSDIFRLHSVGPNTYQNWNESTVFPYNSNARGAIADPDGASAKNEITSIPSPFARIDLIKTAFKEVTRMASGDLGKLEGNTIFHKMISDSLDIGEIFFNIDKYKEEIQIITWQPSVMLDKLLNSGNERHKCVADSLQKYMIADALTYNFAQMKNIYMLNYVNSPDELNIIGATSPATLFFSGANKLDYVKNIFFANNDRPFDDDYQPLYKRDPEYIKAFWTLRNSMPNFAINFPEIETYLNQTFQAINDQSLKNELNQITSASISNYSPIDVNTQQQNFVEVLGVNLLKKKPKAIGKNEFSIKPDFSNVGVLPLVLPVESGNRYATLKYVNGTWGTKNKAPYYDQTQIQGRILPFDGAQFPYLTISDFLEDTIIKVPHSLNSESYFDGGIKIKEPKLSYLLPIKPLYFKFFSVETLRSIMHDGKPAFEMEQIVNGSINVIIRIPIEGNNSIKYIEYKRTYYALNSANVTSTTNDGGVVESNFTGFIMPCKKFTNPTEALYTISCISRFSNQYKLEFYNKEQEIRNIPRDCRNIERGVHDYKAETYTLESQNFDFIRITNVGGFSNLIVPIFLNHQSLETFEFAVDLGTSNTHIELKKSGDSISRPFELAETEILSQFFKTSYREDGSELDLINENELIDIDYIPKIVGSKNDYSFPTRTALSYAKSTDWVQQIRPFGMANVSLTFNKRTSMAYNKRPSITDIKWSNESNAQSAMKTYIQNIMLLIRNKVVVNDGTLSRTKIIWFYPNSMSLRRLSQLRMAWNDAYAKMFDVNGVTLNISESVAPIQYYFKRYATATNLINIDIGGATTDIAFAKDGVVNYMTSFKFAANTLFKDSFSDQNIVNGIVDFYKDDIYKVLQSGGNELSELAAVFEENITRPIDMASFLFSLKDSSATKGLAENSIDFNVILQNDTKFKIVFIIFYTAIIYHIARIIKEKKLETPRHIAFSGNGSKIVKILSVDTTILSNYTKVIFEKVLERPYENHLEILGFERNVNPKESTCKGGLLSDNYSHNNINQLILLDSKGRFVEGDTYGSLDEIKKKEIVESVKDFFTFTLDTLPKVYNFDDNFGVEKASLDVAIEECKKDLDTYLDKGVKMSIEESGNINNIIEDALSFYPIKGVINAISLKINEHFKSK